MIIKILVVVGIWLAIGVIILPLVVLALKNSNDRLGPPPIK